MTTLRTAAEAVIEQLKGGFVAESDPVAQDLKAALAEEALQRLTDVQQEMEQEPVAWAVYDIKHGGSKALHWPEQHSPNGDPEQYKAVPLYTAPPQRKPLTDEEIIDLWSWSMTVEAERTATTQQHAFARAIERAHGIK